MKNTFYAALTTVLFLAAGFAAQPAAAGVFDNPSPVKYERYDKGYFEKNNSGHIGERRSFLMFNDQAKFDTVFAPAAGMGVNTFLPDNVFESRFVFAVVRRGMYTTSYMVTNVVRDLDKLRIYYEAEERPKSSNIRSPLILAIDNADFDYSEIIVTENGKDVLRQNLKD